MKLNPDCIRDILLTVEETTDAQNIFEYDKPESYYHLSKYSNNEIRYHLKQCNHSELFIGYQEYFGNNILINDLSPKGHNFIENIRENSIWNKLKEKAKKAGYTSLDALIKIAPSVIAQLFDSHQ